MGCSGSQPAQGANSSENEAIVVSKENSANGSADQLKLAKTGGAEATENLLQDANATEENKLNLTNGAPVKRTGQAEINSLKRTKTKRDGKGIENAWSVSKVSKNIEKEVIRKPAREVEELADFESEYGKDGVDLTSSHVDGEQDNEKLINSSLGTRTSPDGTCTNKQRGVHKKDSDEAFDPSSLIDIEKFRAANAPTKQMQTSKIESETSNIKTDENRNERNITANTNGHTVTVASPSNYNEFYDDDEKQLIASIENDFKTTSSFALPGSVL